MTQLILVLALAHATGGQAPNPDAIVSTMLAKYSKAQSVAGKITLTQVAGNQRGTLETQLHYVKPSKLRILQSQAAPEKREWLVLSDGELFTYPLPEEIAGVVREGERLWEAIRQKDRLLEVRDIYLAASRSLKDRSAPLDIAIGRREDLEFLLNQWASLRYIGKQEVGGVPVHVVGGNWREYLDAPSNGVFELYIDEDHRLLRYVIKGDVAAVDPRTGALTAAQTVASIWDVDLQIDAPVDPKVFQIRRAGR
jgi:hypothetical protein